MFDNLAGDTHTSYSLTTLQALLILTGLCRGRLREAIYVIYSSSPKVFEDDNDDNNDDNDDNNDDDDDNDNDDHGDLKTRRSMSSLFLSQGLGRHHCCHVSYQLSVKLSIGFF